MNDEMDNMAVAEKPAKAKSKRNRLILALFGGIILCCCGLLAVGAVRSNTPEGQARATARAEERAAAEVVRAETAEAKEASSAAEVVSSATEAGKPTKDTPPTDVPEPTDTPAPTNTPKPDGNKPETAVPFGEAAVSGNYILQVEEVVRPADQRIEEANMFNSEAEPGNELMMVRMTIECTEASDRTCTFTPSADVEVFGSSGIIREPEIFVSGLPNMLEYSEFFGGSVIRGWMVFEIGQDETNLVLKFVPLFSLMDPIYLAIPDETSE